MTKKYTKELLQDAVFKCTTYRELAIFLGLLPHEGNQSYLGKLVRLYEIDYSHFKGMGWSKNGGSHPGAQTKEEFLSSLIEGSNLGSSTTRGRLIKFGIKEARCEKCGLTEWLGESAPFDLDHINGDHFDNRLENLMILCANCHALKTFNERKGARLDKDTKRLRSKTKRCPSCLKQISKSAYFCEKHAHTRARKIERPSKEQLLVLIQEKPMTEIGKQFGVSDSAVRKWCCLYGIEIPKFPRGHWLKGKSPIRAYNSSEKLRKVGPEGTSWCTGCKSFFPVHNFCKDAGRWNGLDKSCKNCKKKRKNSVHSELN